MNRGSRVSPLLLLAGAPCFNEAPIHESGKSALGQGLGAGRGRLQ